MHPSFTASGPQRTLDHAEDPLQELPQIRQVHHLGDQSEPTTPILIRATRYGIPDEALSTPCAPASSAAAARASGTTGSGDG